MRHRLLLLLLLIVIALVGCKAVTTIQAADTVASAYQELIPGVGETRILVMQPYQGGMVVLATKQQANQETTMDLFVVSDAGVIQTASGVLSTQKQAFMNHVINDDKMILFGNLPDENTKWVDVAAGEEAVVGKALVTLKNWKIEEVDVPLNQGFVFVVNSKSPVEVLKLFDADGDLIGHYKKSDGNLYEAELADYQSLPLPVEISAAQISEIKITQQPDPPEDKFVLLEGEIIDTLLAAYNKNMPLMSRISNMNSFGTEVAMQLTNGLSVKMLHKEGNTIHVRYESGESINCYRYESEELAKLLREFQKQIP